MLLSPLYASCTKILSMSVFTVIRYEISVIHVARQSKIEWLKFSHPWLSGHRLSWVPWHQCSRLILFLSVFIRKCTRFHPKMSESERLVCLFVCLFILSIEFLKRCFHQRGHWSSAVWVSMVRWEIYSRPSFSCRPNQRGLFIVMVSCIIANCPFLEIIYSYQTIPGPWKRDI